MSTQVRDLKHLKELVKDDEMTDFFVALMGGSVRSSKGIMRDDDAWYVNNEIDDTEEGYQSDDELMKSFVGEALAKGALYMY